MSTKAIDISAGLVPSQSQNVDLSAGLVPAESDDQPWYKQAPKVVGTAPSPKIDFSDLGGKQVSPAPSPKIDFSDLGGKQVSPAPSPKIDFSDLGGKVVAPATSTAAPTAADALSKATGLSAGPSWLGRKWNEVKGGLTGAQSGGGLKPQPTALGNAAEMAGGIAEGIYQLGEGPEMAGVKTGIGATELATRAQNAVADLLPAARLARASSAFQHVSNTIGENAVETTDELKSAMDAVKENIGGTKPPVLSQLMDRLTSNEGPLSYDEARSAYHNLSDLAATDKMSMNKNMSRLLGNFKSALGKAIQNTTDAAGLGDTYKGAMTDFAKGSQQQEKLSAITDWIKQEGWKTAAGGAAFAGGSALAVAGWNLYKKLFPD